MSTGFWVLSVFCFVASLGFVISGLCAYVSYRRKRGLEPTSWEELVLLSISTVGWAIMAIVVTMIWVVVQLEGLD